MMTLQRPQKGDERDFLVSRELEPVLMARDRAMVDLVAFEVLRNVIVAQPGGIEPLFQAGVLLYTRDPA